MEINLKKDLNNIDEVPPLEHKNMYYNCSECQ